MSAFFLQTIFFSKNEFSLKSSISQKFGADIQYFLTSAVVTVTGMFATANLDVTVSGGLIYKLCCLTSVCRHQRSETSSIKGSTHRNRLALT